MRRGPWSLAVGVLFLALVAVVTVVRIAPTPVRDADAPAAEFSAARAYAHVEAIARAPHPVGTQAHEDVRAYLLGVLGAMGLETRVQETVASQKAAAVVHAASVRNVIARLPGARPGPAVLLAAHYDSVPQSPGAADDAAGVAALLETARALSAGPRMEHDVLFLFSDAEELASLGALAFTEQELEAHPVAVALNFEARGTGGAVALYDLSDGDGALVQAVSRAVPRVVSNSLLSFLAGALPNDSDASMFKRAKIPTYAFAFVDRVYQYHQATDALGALDLRSLQHDGDYALPLARELASGPLPLPASPDVVYFDVFGRWVCSYSTLTARVLGLLGVLGYVLLVRRIGAREHLTYRKVAARGVLALCGVVAAALAAGGMHALLRAMLGPFMLQAHPRLAVVAGAALALAFATGAFALLLRKGAVVETVMGSLGAWAAICLVTSLAAPTTSFVFLWPLLSVTLGLALWLRTGGARSAWAGPVLTLGLAPAAFFWSYLAYAVYETVGVDAPETVATVVVMSLMVASPWLAALGSRGAAKLAALAGGVAVVTALVGGIAAGRDTSVPRPDDLVFLSEPAARVAKWTTTQAVHDRFVLQRVPKGRTNARAALQDVPPLQTTVRTADEGGAKHTSLTVASPRRARCVRFWEVTHEPILETKVDGKPVGALVRFSAALDDALVRLLRGGSDPSSWVMEYCGLDQAGFRLDLTSPAGRPVTLRVHEIVDGLPGPALTPRTSGEYASSESDVSIASMNITF